MTEQYVHKMVECYVEDIKEILESFKKFGVLSQDFDVDKVRIIWKIPKHINAYFTTNLDKLLRNEPEHIHKLVSLFCNSVIVKKGYPFEYRIGVETHR